MWQLLLGVAVAGSTGLLAKHLFNPNPNNPISPNTPNSNLDKEKQHLHLLNGSLESGCESDWEEKQKQDGIFRFSSPESAGKTEVKAKGRNLRKRVVLKKAEKGSNGAGVEVNRRKFYVCLKKRRTSKNVAYKCGSCPSKDSSVFRWGLGFGIMYMLSAGKAEINKLNSAMDETAKVVQELKTELCKRKSSCNPQASNSSNEVATTSKKLSGKNMQLLLDKPGTGNRDHNEINVCSLPVIDDGEYASSVLTEEPPEPEVVEMDQLEAELESELQKLSETEVSAKNFNEPLGQRFDSYECQGVLPSELDQKLCHLLIEQQENHIEELESELNVAQSKLCEKEVELQALKDSVRRLTNLSLSTISDDDAEVQGKQECMNDQDCPIKSGSETRKSLVGMKRPIES
ncbi:hypothetical protein REPUB_Repub06bG0183200 [Reevesia pubescens]